MAVGSTRGWGLLSGVAGVAICASVAGMLTAVFRNRSAAAAVPWLFLLIIPVVARFLGSGGAMIGTFAGALIFAAFLFAPIGSTAIADKGPRDSLLLMLSLGIPAAYFAGRSSISPDERQGRTTSEDEHS